MNNEKVGEKIKKLRKERGLSQTELAERLEISDSYLSKIERGQRISFKVLDRFAEFFGKDRSYFFTNEEEFSDFTEAEKDIFFERNLSPEYLMNTHLEGVKVSKEEAEYMITLIKTLRASRDASN
ncbi:helix-turn-helix transcriptional regulator [Metabacillus indicus]|uniref:helix-turn-helix domain-containing protein n=1 Tax=Metabacillus indicus TaxID=246786 RepID=UPI002A0129BE|nr:helix-turn-helix transcriptional regulator [Metabacillus indicus]MDX8288866.1 helix-turn-helix transcriptional regulator [Metabacillus indicus]